MEIKLFAKNALLCKNHIFWENCRKNSVDSLTLDKISTMIYQNMRNFPHRAALLIILYITKNLHRLMTFKKSVFLGHSSVQCTMWTINLNISWYHRVGKNYV